MAAKVTASLWKSAVNSTIINKELKEQVDDVNGVELAKQINRSIMNLYAAFLSEDGKYVDYVGMSKSPEYQQFDQETRKLRKFENLHELSLAERKAFFLNLYNALVIHGYILHGVPTGFMKKMLFYQKMSYQIGSYSFSVDDIEHGILRGNRKHPAFFMLNPQFLEDDPRRKFSFNEVDPRIHFALVCGAKSCPPIRIYTPENIERGLDAAAIAFCGDEDNVQIDPQMKQVGLSQIFNWYMGDFVSSKSKILSWICTFLSEERKEKMNQITSIPEPKIVYLKYNWEVNTKSQLPTGTETKQ